MPRKDEDARNAYQRAFYHANRERQLRLILANRRKRRQAETPGQRAAHAAKRRKWYR
jgi:hypothetical protein